jgi:RHH-type rel operon transcriptional repressor/antitoxin RelB
VTTKVISMRMPHELSERYTRLAEKTGRSRSFYINEALADSIDRFEYEYGILKDVEDFRVGKLKTYSLVEVSEMLGLDD